jgi:hypothetical protein
MRFLTTALCVILLLMAACLYPVWAAPAPEAPDDMIAAPVDDVVAQISLEPLPVFIAPGTIFELLDPCNSADVEYRWYLNTARRIECSDLNCFEVGTFHLVDDSYRTVAYLTLQIYQSILDQGTFVSSRDTFVILGDEGFTLFGRSSNTQEGMIGAKGRIVEAMDASGRPIGVRGSYLYSGWHENPTICFWFE